MRSGWTAALSLLVACGFCALSGTVILELRADTWAHAREAGMNLNRAVGQDIERTLGTLDLALLAVADRLAVDDISLLDRTLRSPLFDRSAMARHIGAVFVLDAAGEVLGNNGPNPRVAGTYAEREYFRVHRERPDAGLYLSRPLLGRVSGQWVVALSRRWNTADGQFAGVVVATLQLEYFRRIFASLALGPDGRVTLLRDDGIALMRVPYEAGQIGRDFSGGTAFRAIPTAVEGSYRSVSSQDGVERFYIFRRLETLPLIINLGMAIDTIEAEWRVRAIAIGGTTLALVLALLTATWLLRRELGRRQAAELAARESEAGFRLLAENTGDMVSRIGSDGLRAYVSPAAQRILGRPPEQMVGRPAQDGIHAEDLPQLATALAKLRSRALDEVTVTYRSWRVDGTEIWLESTLRTVVDGTTGMLDGVVAVSRDITERKALERQLATLARLDGLTGVANRRAFDEAIGREWSRCMLGGMPISVIMVDADRFKAFNDHYGHQGGDACLRVVAATVGATIRRAGDLVARYGGEEFTVLLPDTDAIGATAVAERLRREVEALHLPHAGCGPDAVVTVSVGVATMRPAIRLAATGAGPLIEAADRSLYEAKQAGRNRVVCAQPIDPLQPMVAE